mgnify:CR=1 FL=1
MMASWRFPALLARPWTGVPTAVLMATLAAILFLSGLPTPAVAQRSSPALQFVHDAEIEQTLRRFARPIFQAAGVDPDAVSITLVQNENINAFVAGGMHMFFHTGLLMKSKNAGQLIGVIAHETGHIAGGHLVRAKDAMEGASAEALLATLVGAAAAIGSRNPGAGAMVMLGGQELARRNYLSFSRAQESAADQAGLSYLEQTGISARGIQEFLENLESQEMLPVERQSEFVRTHPLTHERIETVRAAVARSRHANTPVPAELEELHRRMVAKLQGFLAPQAALRLYKAEDKSLSARYGRAIALYRQRQIKEALALMEGLIAAEPRNPYFHELKGQALLENSQIAPAILAYRKAVALKGESPLLREAFGQALLESREPEHLAEAIRNLEAGVQMERAAPLSWRLLATAYGRQNDTGRTAYALAEEAMARGDRTGARQQAERSLKLLPKGSANAMRAQDILLATQPR